MSFWKNKIPLNPLQLLLQLNHRYNTGIRKTIADQTFGKKITGALPTNFPGSTTNRNTLGLQNRLFNKQLGSSISSCTCVIVTFILFLHFAWQPVINGNST